ncbi:MAG: hypothetical protein KDK24_18630 [Pseudooceanicola sp.]|nr:hypothetical protein [Pseudooceanicola sp.]
MLRTSILRATVALALAGSLAACGDDPLEQGLYGGAVGLGAAVALDANPVAGAALGAGANYLYCQRNPSRC